jgi:CRP-like cAMP-binding protein
LSDDDDREERPEAHYKVQVSLGQDDIDSPLATLSAGELVGEMSLMTGEPRKANCRAVTDVLCYEFDHATLQGVLTTRPAIADQMSALLAARQGDLERTGGRVRPSRRREARIAAAPWWKRSAASSTCRSDDQLQGPSDQGDLDWNAMG